MKKQLFWMIGAALALTSCSNDEQVAVNPANEITFRTAVTRATEITKATDLDQFKVKAYYVENTENELHINGDTYISDHNEVNPTFTSESHHYWEPNVTAIKGQAWAPIKNVSDCTTSEIDNYTYSVTIPQNMKDQFDFITADIDGKTPNAQIGVAFGHRLVEVSIQAKNLYDDYEIKIKDVQIGGIKTGTEGKATFTVTTNGATGSWTDLTENAIYKYTLTEGQEPTKVEYNADDAVNLLGEGNYFMLFPQENIKEWDLTTKINPNAETLDDGTGAYIALLAQIKHIGDNSFVHPDTGTSDEYEWLVVPMTTQGAKWEMGKKYTYILNFNDGAIGYSKDGDGKLLETALNLGVSVGGWTAGNSNEPEMTK